MIYVYNTIKNLVLIVTIVFAFAKFPSAATQQSVISWGRDNEGQISAPSPPTGVAAISAGWLHNLALKRDGTVEAWGGDDDGQAAVPLGLNNVVAISAGSGNHSLALKGDGTVVAWGFNNYGQTSVPSGLNNVAAIAAGAGGHSLALKSNGTVVGWGRNDHGQTTVPSGLNGVVAISAGGAHSLALKSDGTVVGWGMNRNGETTLPSALTGVVAISAGWSHSLALKSDGTVVAWGADYYDATIVPSGLSGVVAISAGGSHSLVLKSDGTVVGWGRNDDGQAMVPPGLNGVVAISAGGQHSMVIGVHSPGVPTQIGVRAGNNQQAYIGTSVSIPPSVIVRDYYNNPVPGVLVTFTEYSGYCGGGITGGSQITNAQGIAVVGSWTLGSCLGPYTLTATVTGLAGSPVTFTATGTPYPGIATQIQAIAGNYQQAYIGTSVSNPPSIIVLDYYNNPVSKIPITFTVSSGGGTITGDFQITNAQGIATVGSWTLGSSAGTNTLTAHRSGLPLGSTDIITFTFFATGSSASPPIISSVPAVVTQGGSSNSPGSIVTITQTLTNPYSVVFPSTFVATIPLDWSAISCSVPFGLCKIESGTKISPGDNFQGISRKSTLSALSSTQTVIWTGTIPAKGTLTITYLVQVGVQSRSGTTYCVTSTINGTAGKPACILVTAPSSGPGNLPIAAGLPSQQKPASLLIFNVYTSSSSSAQSDSQISLTNTNPISPINVHLFFIDGASCTVADQIITLTQNQTASFMARDVDPGVTGFIIAVAVDLSGCPVVSNYLVGGSVIKFDGGHRASLPAIGVSGLVTPICTAGSTTVTLAFNGVAYDELPRALAVHTLPSLANGNSPMVIINRIGGDLTTGAERIGSLTGLLYDDSEMARSFTITGGNCQLRGLLGNNLPRTTPRYTTVIPAGRTGWMKFWTVEDQAISGVMINEAVSGLSGGYNLQTLTTTNAATLTIPVIPN